MAVKNVELAQDIVRRLAESGVREVILCAGARNAPFVSVLSRASGLNVHSFFDERSAGFFAIGRMQVTGDPVVVCTTSGTAVAELLPPVIEADYQGLPLIVLSADRPRAYRGTGSPQTIAQPGIFSHYVENSWDIEGELPADLFKIGRRPLHVNVCFDEPLLDASASDWTVAPSLFVEQDETSSGVTIPFKKPLVILGGLTTREAERVAPLVKSWRRPVYAEATSNLRGESELADIEVVGGADSVASFDFDGVIRIGQVPTLRYWRDLEKNKMPVMNFASQRLSGLARENSVLSLSALFGVASDFSPWSEAERAKDLARAEKLADLLKEFPGSETAWVRRLSRWVPNEARVFIGNSLPIREWDLAAARTRAIVHANRGVNGIDGLVSTFLGLATPERPTWGVIGDLSALYDLSGPWAARNLKGCSISLAIINNGGGKIFNRIFNNPLFENQHDVEFSGWARLWNWDYIKLTHPDSDLGDEVSQPRILEIVPDEGESRAFDEAWEKVQC